MTNTHRIFQALSILSKRDKRILGFFSGIQFFLSFLDLAGIAFIALLGVLTVSKNTTVNENYFAQRVFEFLYIDGLSLNSQLVIVGFIGALCLVTRTILSTFVTKKLIYFLSQRATKCSVDLFHDLLQLPLLQIQKIPIHELIFSVIRGVDFVFIQLIGSCVIIVSDLALFLVLGSALFAVDFVTTIVAIGLMLIVSLFLYVKSHKRSVELGKFSTDYNFKSNRQITNAFEGFRETVVSNKQEFFVREFSKTRYALAEASAKINFMPYIGKYAIETLIVFSAILIGGIQFALKDLESAVGTTLIFLAAGGRLAPAILRIQQGYLQAVTSLGYTETTLSLLKNSKRNLPETAFSESSLNNLSFLPKVNFENVYFQHVGRQDKILDDVSFEINEGETTAIFGKSGVGKSTLIDLMLGLIQPDSGVCEISGLQAASAIKIWPGRVAYVPQEINIETCSIREMLTNGLSIDPLNEEQIWKSLRIAQVDDFVNSLPGGLDYIIEERSSSISGGQKQRLGIARAMMTEPTLLILDEATSSLDVETESNLTRFLESIKGKVTIVIVTHKLNSIKFADQYFLLDKGLFKIIKNFEDLLEEDLQFGAILDETNSFNENQ